MSATDSDGVVDVAGHPRLVVATDGHAAAGSSEAAGVQREFVLDRDLITIGSADDQDVQVPGLEPERAPVIVAGAVILLEAMRYLGLREIAVSERDLLDGAALEAAKLPEPVEGDAPPGAYTCC